jgi:hypothetical protein
MPFLGDDLIIIKSALRNPFPLFGDWISSNRNYLRPFTIFSFWVNIQICGISPFGFYILNLMVHLANSYLVFLIYKALFRNIYKTSSRLSYLVPLIFFAYPQNFQNLFWISERHDFLCMFFLLLATLMMLIFLKEGCLNTLLVSLVSFAISLLIKETAIIYIFYVFGFTLIFNAERKRHINYITLVVAVLIVYFIYRGLIFKNLFGVKLFNYGFSIEYIIYYISYSLLSLSLPFDFLDLIYLYENYFVGFIFLVVITISYYFGLVTLLILSIKEKSYYVIIFFVLSSSSLVIYLNFFPSFRLMYLHLLLIIIGVTLFVDKYDSSFFNRIFVLSVFVVFSIGNVFVIARVNNISDYHVEYSKLLSENILKSINEDIKIIDIARLYRLCQTWSNIDANLLIESKQQTPFLDSINVVSTPYFYEAYSLSDYKNSLNYKYLNDNKINVEINNNCDILLPPDETKSTKFSYVEKEFYTKDSIKVELVSYSNMRRGYAKSINITFPNNDKQNIYVIYRFNSQLKIESYENFIKEIRS